MDSTQTTSKRQPYHFAKRLKYEGPEPKWEWPGLCVGPYRYKKRGIGSYDATVITGLNKYKSPFALYLEIRGEIPRGEAKFPELAEIGLLLEPVVAEWYTNKTKRVLIDRAEYTDRGGRWDVRAHPEFAWIVANLDLEIEDPALTPGAERLPWPAKGNGVLEIKSKDPWADFFDERGNPVLDVQVQIQHQLFACQLEWGSTAVLLGRKPYRVDMRAHEGFQAWLFNQEKEFWERCFNGDPPDIDSAEATGAAIESKWSKEIETKVIELDDHGVELASRFHFLDRVIKDAKDEKDLVTNKLKFIMGDSEKATGFHKGEMTEYAFTWKKDQDGQASYVIKGKREPSEEKVIEKLGGEYKPGKKGTRRFLPKKPKKHEGEETT
jgi:predicted phage-related endonuclease